MKMFLILFFFVLSSSLFFGQILDGTWQGILVQTGDKLDKCAIIYLTIKEENGKFTGVARHEMPGNTTFAYTTVTGKIISKANENKKIELSENSFSKKKETKGSNWCVIKFKLSYDEKMGYLEGDYASNFCKHGNGKIILYKSEKIITNEEDKNPNHFWFDQLVKNKQLGLPAPTKIASLTKNFDFKPVYFEYGKDSLFVEYFDYLKAMAIVIKGHSDLRIKVTGNTDSDGSDLYNEDLSKRRAKAIIDFFKTQGLTEDKVVIDFKGEKNPVSDNKTQEGKQKNRRVDFVFI